VFERIIYYCVHCGRKRLGPLASEANSLNTPCECGGSIHWSSKQPIPNCRICGEVVW
jgi:hypothetical protein